MSKLEFLVEDCLNLDSNEIGLKFQTEWFLLSLADNRANASKLWAFGWIPYT